jgi:outer membrane protein
MKKILVFPIAFLMLSVASFAQRYAVVDARYIMDKMPEYKLAQAQLDQTANNWQKEIDAMQRQLDSMYRDFEAEEMMLSQELKKEKDELFNKEKAVRDLQRKRFGFEGDLFIERQKL